MLNVPSSHRFTAQDERDKAVTALSEISKMVIEGQLPSSCVNVILRKTQSFRGVLSLEYLYSMQMLLKNLLASVVVAVVSYTRLACITIRYLRNLLMICAPYLHRFCLDCGYKAIPGTIRHGRFTE